MEKEKRRPASSELEALQRIGEKGGKIDYRALAAELGFGSHYMSVICRALGNADHIDFKASGICALTLKGREELRRKGLLTEEIEKKLKEKELKDTFGRIPTEFGENPGAEKGSKSSSTRKARIKSAEELFAKRTWTGMEEGVTGLPAQKPQIPREAVPLNDVELQALKELGQCGGRMAGRNLASRVGRSYESMDRYYRTLGHADLIDYMGSGVCVLTPKGRELLGKMGLLV